MTDDVPNRSSKKRTPPTPDDVAQFLADAPTLIAHSQTLYELRDQLSKAVWIIESVAHETTPQPTHFAFLSQGPQDKKPWPTIYSDRELAQKAPNRVSDIVPVRLLLPVQLMRWRIDSGERMHTVVYPGRDSYGCANEDTRNTGVEHVAVSVNESGEPFFTVPKKDLVAL